MGFSWHVPSLGKGTRLVFDLGARDGKYYFFANGNPGRDEDAEECIINIYAFKQGK